MKTQREDFNLARHNPSPRLIQHEATKRVNLPLDSKKGLINREPLRKIAKSLVCNFSWKQPCIVSHFRALKARTRFRIMSLLTTMYLLMLIISRQQKRMFAQNLAIKAQLFSINVELFLAKISIKEQYQHMILCKATSYRIAVV